MTLPPDRDDDATPDEHAEVVLFIIPGAPKHWSSVVDVRSASRLPLAGFDSPTWSPGPDELVLNAEPDQAAGPPVSDLDLVVAAEDGVFVDRPLVQPESRPPARFEPPVPAVRAPRSREWWPAARAAAIIVLAFAVGRIIPEPPADRPAAASEAAPESAARHPAETALAARALGTMTRLAPVVGNRRPALDAATPSDVARQALSAAPRSSNPVVRPAAAATPPRTIAAAPPRTNPVAARANAVGAPATPVLPPQGRPSDVVAAVMPRTMDDDAAGDIATPPDSEPAPGPSLSAPAAEATGPVTAAPRRDTAERDGISAALEHLQLAYARRDAALAKAVWPTVDERALARAFDGLRSQSVRFDRCQLTVAGSAGEVECRGITTYVPRVGGRYQRTESRQWTFRVQKGDDSWVITSAAAR